MSKGKCIFLQTFHIFCEGKRGKHLVHTYHVSFDLAKQKKDEDESSDCNYRDFFRENTNEKKTSFVVEIWIQQKLAQLEMCRG